MCVIISEEKLKTILENMTAEEIAKLAWENWVPQMKSGIVIVELEKGEIMGISLGQNESLSPDFRYVEIYEYKQNSDNPDIDELLDDDEFKKLLKWKEDRDWTQNEWEALEKFCIEKKIDLNERILTTIAYWIDEYNPGLMAKDKDDWIKEILNQYHEYLHPFGDCRAKTKYDEIADLYESQKKRIMKHVHKSNAFGQTETQITVFRDEIRLADHLTPSLTTYSDDNEALFAFDVTHNPFLSYDELDDLFYSNLVQYQHVEEIEQQEKADRPYNIAESLIHEAQIFIKSAQGEIKEDGSASEGILSELETVKELLENIKGELDPLSETASKVRGTITIINEFF